MGPGCRDAQQIPLAARYRHADWVTEKNRTEHNFIIKFTLRPHAGGKQEKQKTVRVRLDLGLRWFVYEMTKWLVMHDVCSNSHKVKMTSL